jgi:hypothetical protein
MDGVSSGICVCICGPRCGHEYLPLSLLREHLLDDVSPVCLLCIYLGSSVCRKPAAAKCKGIRHMATKHALLHNFTDQMLSIAVMGQGWRPVWQLKHVSLSCIRAGRGRAGAQRRGARDRGTVHRLQTRAAKGLGARAAMVLRAAGRLDSGGRDAGSSVGDKGRQGLACGDVVVALVCGAHRVWRLRHAWRQLERADWAARRPGRWGLLQRHIFLFVQRRGRGTEFSRCSRAQRHWGAGGAG